jgi:hypothetical protein
MLITGVNNLLLYNIFGNEKRVLGFWADLNYWRFCDKLCKLKF